MKYKFKFGDKVFDWIDKKKCIIVKRTRGYSYIIVDEKGQMWKSLEGRLEKLKERCLR